MTPQAQVALDAALSALRDIARNEGLYSVEAYVRSDGRVSITGTTSRGHERWHVRADLEGRSFHPAPSVAMAQRVSPQSSEDT